MGASRKENDFVHLIADTLRKDYSTKFDIINFFQWESMHYDRAEALELLNKFYGKNYDFIVVQLGENIHNIDTLESDFKTLINYLRNKISANAKIVVVGQFWDNDAIDLIKKKVCKETSAYFVNLKDIQTAEYCVGLGSVVFGDDGKEHVVNHQGVAMHPNDKAMRVCAERILQALNWK